MELIFGIVFGEKKEGEPSILGINLCWVDQNQFFKPLFELSLVDWYFQIGWLPYRIEFEMDDEDTY